MKKFTKIAAMAAGILAVMGVVSLIAAFAMGLTWNTVVDMFEQGEFSIQLGDNSFGIDAVSKSQESKEIQEDCKNLEIELAAGALEIYYSDVEHIQIEQDNVKGFEAYVKDDTLHIEGSSKVGINNGDASIVILLPQSMKFNKVDLEIDAGQAEIDSMIANELSVEVGAGQAIIRALNVMKLTGEVGAGQLSVELLGNEADYNYYTECGIGEIQIDGSSYGGLGKAHKCENQGADKTITLECGVGEIQINFTK